MLSKRPRLFVQGSTFSSSGSMTQDQFKKLIAISPIKSEKVIVALEDFFVNGMTRKAACCKNNVAQGQFSLSIRKLLRINELVAELAHFYCR
ncbi:PapB/FocB family fimbrial expression transcriptional regulator [Escherichia coli]|uniref:PapB/FocB family fimbrial expression transcriptional regulator n=1 Tax=Escherichia coli TaxID=562 RepID=UPI0039DF388B